MDQFGIRCAGLGKFLYPVVRLSINPPCVSCIPLVPVAPPVGTMPLLPILLEPPNNALPPLNNRSHWDLVLIAQDTNNHYKFVCQLFKYAYDICNSTS